MRVDQLFSVIFTVSCGTLPIHAKRRGYVESKAGADFRGGSAPRFLRLRRRYTEGNLVLPKFLQGASAEYSIWARGDRSEAHDGTDIVSRWWSFGIRIPTERASKLASAFPREWRFGELGELAKIQWLE